MAYEGGGIATKLYSLKAIRDRFKSAGEIAGAVGDLVPWVSKFVPGLGIAEAAAKFVGGCSKLILGLSNESEEIDLE